MAVAILQWKSSKLTDAIRICLCDGDIRKFSEVRAEINDLYFNIGEDGLSRIYCRFHCFN